MTVPALGPGPSLDGPVYSIAFVASANNMGSIDGELVFTKETAFNLSTMKTDD